MTGASGPKVGHVVARELAAAHEVFGVDARPGAHTQVVTDIRDVRDWSPWLEGVGAIIHFAALHAPHRETHSREEFIATNVEATQRLLEAAQRAGVGRFVLASSTSVYGKSMRRTGRAAWVTETMEPVPEDIYDETKLAAEALCREAFSSRLATLAIRFSRSFPEPLPLMASYRLHRGVDARDVAQAFGRALEVPLAGFEAFNVSGATPFLESDVDALWHDAPGVLRHRAPDLAEEFTRRGWALPARIDRVYVIDKARAGLGFAPRHGWRAALEGQG